ncbi:MAG: hypothetical protein BGO67_05675 [Alphaproteobacteria bacterium 41-28]|nr:MAG: hypothetical protein BGO67_05675 [Alphaproteobacteria bacterium 41-28]
MKKLATLAVLGVIFTAASANAGEFLQDVAYYGPHGGGVGGTCNTCNIPTTTCKPTCCTPTCVYDSCNPCGKMVCCPEIVGIFGKGWW